MTNTQNARQVNNKTDYQAVRSRCKLQAEREFNAIPQIREQFRHVSAYAGLLISKAMREPVDGRDAKQPKTETRR